MSKLLEERLEEIFKLRDGWYGGEGIGFISDDCWYQIIHFKDLIDVFSKTNPKAFPTLDGEILFEWQFKNNYVAELTFQPKTRKAELFICELGNIDFEEIFNLDFNKYADILFVNEKIRLLE